MEEIENENNFDKSGLKLQANLILIVIGTLLIIAAVLLYPQARQQMEEKNLSTLAFTPTQEFLPTIAAPSPVPTREAEVSNHSDPEFFAYPNQFGTLILSIREGVDAHLFAYQPFLEDWSGEGFTGLPLTRLTNGSHQDITPDISADGRRIAFASNRNGPWDIFILDLATGEIQQFTDTAAYDANPTWSPDGQWLVYESYQINNLEIIIQDVEKTTGPIPLTNNPAADYAPDWSNQGRLISFISNRSGRNEVWYADLDSPNEDKAVLIKDQYGENVQHPTWSGNGRYLSWGLITSEGDHSLVTWDSQHPERQPVDVGSGDWPLWGGDADILYAVLHQPQGDYLSAYPGCQADPQVLLPAVTLPGRVEGISWIQGNIYPSIFDLDPGPDPTPLWEPSSRTEENPGVQRKDLITLRDLTAPSPIFTEDAVRSFSLLRSAVIEAAGWDFLSTLENAYVPLNQPLSPGVNLDWLFTGRAMVVNDIPRLAGWLVLVREDYRSQTYWRVYIKAYDQNGYQGRPLHTEIWDLDARYSGNNTDYENGGAFSFYVPEGYWVDFTSLAEAHGWTRFPAEPYWQFSEKASRYQYFAFTQDLNLKTALLDLYSLDEIQSLVSPIRP